MLPTIVLAAGLGTRLLPLTRHLAKPAVPVAGKALIVRVLEWLAHEGIEDVVVNLHHLPATVTGIVGDGAHLGLRVRYSWERQILGSAGGPRLALSLWPDLAEPCLITNGDTLTNVPLKPFVAAHRAARARGGLVSMAVVPNTRPDHYNGVRLDRDGRVLAFVPKGHTEETWHFVGVQIAEPRVFDAIPIGTAAETVSGIYRTLVHDQPGAVWAHRLDASFLDVGTPADYLDACLHTATVEGRMGGVVMEAPWTAEGLPARIDPGARLTRCVVWPDAIIESGVELDRCVILSGARVPVGTRARDQVFE